MHLQTEPTTKERQYSWYGLRASGYGTRAELVEAYECMTTESLAAYGLEKYWESCIAQGGEKIKDETEYKSNAWQKKTNFLLNAVAVFEKQA
jgi:hypothetical protein